MQPSPVSFGPAALGAAALAAAVAFALTPLLSLAAARAGFVDRPDGRLKRQLSAVPYAGGLALALSYAAAWWLSGGALDGGSVLALPALLVFVVGLIDDRAPLHWAPKLAVQILAAALAVNAGLAFAMPGLPFWCAATASVLWLVAVTNAFNIIDVSDGLCAAVGIATAVALVALAGLGGQPAVALPALVIGAALAGFLPWNLAPARAYLGDAGAYLVGFVLAAVGIAIERADALPGLDLAAVALVLGAPVFDLLYVVALRAAAGRNPFLGSDDHVAVRLRRLGWTADRIALAGVTVTLGCALAGVAAALVSGRAALAVVAVAAVAMVGGGARLRQRSARVVEPLRRRPE